MDKFGNIMCVKADPKLNHTLKEHNVAIDQFKELESLTQKLVKNAVATIQHTHVNTDTLGGLL